MEALLPKAIFMTDLKRLIRLYLFKVNYICSRKTILIAANTIHIIFSAHSCSGITPANVVIMASFSAGLYCQKFVRKSFGARINV